MRADRLLTLLMLLQTRGRMTAAQLAHALEVSVRTVYRDIEALGAAGVPVYAESGPGGGCALVEGYRTTLTGMTQDEVRALFMLSVPAPLAQLGVSRELRTALLKLTAALPAVRRADEERVRGRIHLDATGWATGDEAVPHLQTLYRAVWDDHRVYLAYETFLGVRLEPLVDPYGLVAKAGIWHLVCSSAGQMRVHRVAHLLDVRPAGERFLRPDDFDLAAFWNAFCVETERARPMYAATVRLAPALADLLPRYFGERARDLASSTPDAEGWTTAVLPFESFEAARARILGFGGAAEVLAPEALRRSVADFAGQVVARYGQH